MAWLSFIELDKAVVHVIRLASFLWLWFSLSALLFPFSMPTLLVGFPLPWMWSISSPLLQQSTAAAPDLGRRVSPLGCRSWPWTWGIASRPSSTTQSLLAHSIVVQLDWLVFCDCDFQSYEVLWKSLMKLPYPWKLCDPWTAACQASLSITKSRSLLTLTAIKPSHPLLSPLLLP